MQTFKASGGIRTGATEYKYSFADKLERPDGKLDDVHLKGEITGDAPFKVYVINLNGELVPVGYAIDGQFSINRRFSNVIEFCVQTAKTTVLNTCLEMFPVRREELLDPTPIAIADETTIERQLRSEDYIRRELRRMSAAAVDSEDDRDDLPFADENDEMVTGYQELDTIAEEERLASLAKQTEAEAEADPATEEPGPSGDVTREEGQRQEENDGQ